MTRCRQSPHTGLVRVIGRKMSKSVGLDAAQYLQTHLFGCIPGYHILAHPVQRLPALGKGHGHNGNLPQRLPAAVQLVDQDLTGSGAALLAHLLPQVPLLLSTAPTVPHGPGNGVADLRCLSGVEGDAGHTVGGPGQTYRPAIVQLRRIAVDPVAAAVGPAH